jgi:hypothetical protein
LILLTLPVRTKRGEKDCLSSPKRMAETHNNKKHKTEQCHASTGTTKLFFSNIEYALNVDQVQLHNFFHRSTTSMMSTNLATLLCVVMVTLTFARPLVREIRTDREFQRLLKVRPEANTHHPPKCLAFLV